MSDHSLRIDVQEVAQCFKEIRASLDVMEYIIQQSLIEENKDGKTNGEGQEGKSN